MFVPFLSCWRSVMITPRRFYLRNVLFLEYSLCRVFASSVVRYCSSFITSSSPTSRVGLSKLLWSQEKPCQDSLEPFLKLLISRIRAGNSEDEVFQSLLKDQSCASISLSNVLVEKLLMRFEDDWKSALGLFRWAQSRPGYVHNPEAWDKMVDILGKSKQIDRMFSFLEEMREGSHITLRTIAKVMRRLAGAGKWTEAIKAFDDLGTFGLEKNTDSMNLLLDTLCKERKVELAREVFLELKRHISPNAHTFNIFVHGWCNAKRTDEAHWTIQEMKGHGCLPSVITYSTIVQSYCSQSNFRKVYEILDDMRTQGCPPNVVTYTTLMHSLAKSNEFEEALQIYEQMKSDGCKPDTLFYNSLIHVLGRAGRLQSATRVFEVEMPMNNVTPNSSTYNTMISMFCHHSQEQSALNVLKEMEASTFCKPDLHTYNPLLKLCFKTGRTDGTLNILMDDMINKHHLSLDLSTSTLLIHGLCRANRCERAYVVFESMISQEIIPRYQTCRLLLEEVKQKYMYDAAERIEDVMKQMKKSK